MGSRVRIRLGAPFDILRFVSSPLFFFEKILSLTLMIGAQLTFSPPPTLVSLLGLVNCSSIMEELTGT